VKETCKLLESTGQRELFREGTWLTLREREEQRYLET